MGLENCAPPESVTCQCHQTVVPGASEPDSSICQVQVTFTSVPGVSWGNALASTVPQVNWFTPYSSTTEVIFAPPLNSALKTMLSGKVRLAASLTTWMPDWAAAGVARLTRSISISTKIMIRDLGMATLPN